MKQPAPTNPNVDVHFQLFDKAKESKNAARRGSTGLALCLLGLSARTMSITNRVLIVEDDENALSGYVEFLTAAGFESVGVTNAAEALPIALTQPPAVVVTDITLPGINGFELAAALRADWRTESVPIIGLTAHWTSDIHTRARGVAMQVILAKPCVPGHLVAELQRLLGRPLSAAVNNG